MSETQAQVPAWVRPENRSEGVGHAQWWLEDGFLEDAYPEALRVLVRGELAGFIVGAADVIGRTVPDDLIVRLGIPEGCDYAGFVHVSEDGPTMYLAPEHASPLLVLHELAHVLSPPPTRFDTHGPPFCRVFCDLLEALYPGAGPYMVECLEDAGVEVKAVA